MFVGTAPVTQAAIIAAGGATVTGSLTADNVAILTATGIKDSGVALVSTLPATTVWGNNSASTAAPAALTVLNMGNGTAGAPIYSFQAYPTIGLYAASGSLCFATTGRKAIEIGTTGASGYSIYAFSNNTPTITTQGTTNLLLQLSGNGTSGVDLMQGQAGSYILRAVGVASAANYLNVTAAASGANVKVGTNAENLVFGSGSALATGATAGMTLFPSCAGTPTGAPTGAGTGAVPFIYDTTANKLWFYNGSWRGILVV